MTTTPDTDELDRDWITVRWHIDDVKEVRPDLTDEQAREVLRETVRYHDAEIGITWDVLTGWAEHLYPEPDEAPESQQDDT